MKPRESSDRGRCAPKDDMTELDYQVDDLLARWHQWRSSYTDTRGYRSIDATCRAAKSAWSAFDRDNGVPEAQLEVDVMRAVERAVDAVPNDPRPWRTYILIDARNLAVGSAVWSSARLPAGEELAVLRTEARNRLTLELARQGCIGG